MEKSGSRKRLIHHWSQFIFTPPYGPPCGGVTEKWQEDVELSGLRKTWMEKVEGGSCKLANRSREIKQKSNTRLILRRILD